MGAAACLIGRADRFLRSAIGESIAPTGFTPVERMILHYLTGRGGQAPTGFMPVEPMIVDQA